MKKYIDGAIPCLGNKFGHFVTVERYEDLHKSKKLKKTYPYDLKDTGTIEVTPTKKKPDGFTYFLFNLSNTLSK